MARKRKDDNTRRLLIDPSGQTEIFEKSYEQEIREERAREVECLGRKFPNDEARRAYFLDRLREYLEDPEFRKTEGFPIGTDEDILALSDPPYYTACPNPFIADFVREHATNSPTAGPYSREPFATDISEGKTGALYDAHSYHTKVPPKAIKYFVEHYTDNNALVLDGFCGTGMTGVACQSTGTSRCSILVDLSPAAGFISNFYNLPVSWEAFQSLATEALDRVATATAPYYAINVPKTQARGTIESIVWATVLTCPACSRQVPFWSLEERDDMFRCPECKGLSNRQLYEYVRESYFDPVQGATRERNKKVPVQAIARVAGKRTAIPVTPELALHLSQWPKDLASLWFPRALFLDKGIAWGDTYRAGYHFGYEYAYDFYFPRTLLGLATLRAYAMAAPIAYRWHLMALLTSVAFAQTHLYKYRTAGGGQPSGNNLYVPALIKEHNIVSALRRKLDDMVKAEREKRSWSRRVLVSTASSTCLRGIPDQAVDYVFVDPPFGANIMYSESSHLWESWLAVRTRQEHEAVVNETQKKGLLEYQDLMEQCFREFYRVLKPGRWMTVEFHNSKNFVWTSIQEAMGRVGFVVADVRTLDKKQGTFKQVTTAGAVKNDLIISAYRPNGGLEKKFELEAGTANGVWSFVRTHLGHLPVFVKAGGQAEIIAERQNFLLFDRMVAFHVQKGVTVPLSASDFYAGLVERLAERDGMFFLPEQAAEYDKKRARVDEIRPLELIPRDEASAIQWVRQELQRKPRTFQDLQPDFMRAIAGWTKHEKPIELSRLLGENFLVYDGVGEIPNQIHSYLSSNFKDLRNKTKDDAALRVKGRDRWYVADPTKTGDLEKLREKALLREFDDYKSSKTKVLKLLRIEAMRAGFKRAYDQRDYRTIVDVAAKIPESVLQEDEKLLMYFDVARTRLGTDEESKLF